MRTRVLRRPIVFLRVRCSNCFRCGIVILLIKLFVVTFVRCSIPHCICRLPVQLAAGLLGLRVRISQGAWMSVFRECYMLSRRDLSLRRTDPSSRAVLPNVVCQSVMSCNNNPLHLQWVGRRGETKKGSKIWRCKIVVSLKIKPLGDSDACRQRIWKRNGTSISILWQKAINGRNL